MTASPSSLPRIRLRSWSQPVIAVPLKLVTTSPGRSPASAAGMSGSVSVHAYSPPLWRMGQYAVSDAGVLRRQSVSYADELRPLDEQPTT